RWSPGKVRVGDPQRPASRAGDELVEAQQPGGAWLVADHPEPGVADQGHLRAPHALAFRNRSTNRGPHPGEGVLDVGDRGSLDLYAGVMPGRDALRRIASPGIGHAEPGDERHPPVDAHRLAVIAVHPSERARPVEGVERPDLDSRLAQGAPDPGTGRE